MDHQTEQLSAALSNSATKIETIQSLLRAGHKVSPMEMDEWINAAGYQVDVFHSMLIMLLADEEDLELQRKIH